MSKVGSTVTDTAAHPSPLSTSISAATSLPSTASTAAALTGGGGGRTQQQPPQSSLRSVAQRIPLTEFLPAINSVADLKLSSETLRFATKTLTDHLCNYSSDLE